MAVLPTVPTFLAGDTSMTRLQQLSDAVAFLSDADIRPHFHIFKNSTASILATTWTTLPGGTLVYDNDGFFNTGVSFTPTIRTQGYYCFEASVPWLTGGTAIILKVGFLFTAGSANPGFVAGATLRFGVRASYSTGIAGTDTTLSASATAPMALYPGDTISLQVFSDTAVSTGFNNNTSYISGRLVPNYTGYMIRTAP